MPKRLLTGDTEPEQYLEPLGETPPVLKLLYCGGLRDERRGLKDGRLPIGRKVDPDGGLALPGDKQASAEHACLQARGDDIVLLDRGSRNHTYLNGEKIREAVVADGDIVRIGQSLLLFRREPGVLPDAPASDRAAHEKLRGTSLAVGRLREMLSRAARSPATVLIRGSTGTGKEPSAEVLHALSGLRGPLVRMNCAQLTGSLAESELFGHADSAFTGARAHKGLLREAHAGTLFLDEIAELARELQPMLLRVLEDSMVRPIGASHPEKIKVRFVAATNRDLNHLVHTAHFREDLLARLAKLPVEMPPLRDRTEDILPLFLQFLGDKERPLTGRLCEALLLYPWPQNVRELQGVAEFAVAMCRGSGPLDLPELRQKLPKPLPAVANGAPLLPTALASAAAPTRRHERYTAELIERLMDEHQGIKAFVAAKLGISRRQLTRYLEKFGIDVQRFRRGDDG